MVNTTHRFRGASSFSASGTVTATAHPGYNQHRPWVLRPTHALAPCLTLHSCRVQNMWCWLYISCCPLLARLPDPRDHWVPGLSPDQRVLFPSQPVSICTHHGSLNMTNQPDSLTSAAKQGFTSTEWKAPSFSGYSQKEGWMLRLGFIPDSKELLLPTTDTIRVNTAYQGESTMNFLSFIPFDSSWDVLSTTQSKFDQDLDHRALRPCINRLNSRPLPTWALPGN